LYIFPDLVCLDQEKSGNPDSNGGGGGAVSTILQTFCLHSSGPTRSQSYIVINKSVFQSGRK
jgi:hypothetical protein